MCIIYIYTNIYIYASCIIYIYYFLFFYLFIYKMIQCTPDHSYVRFLAFYMMQLCIYLSYMCVSILSIYHSIYIYIFFTNYYHIIVILYIYVWALSYWLCNTCWNQLSYQCVDVWMESIDVIYVFIYVFFMCIHIIDIYICLPIYTNIISIYIHTIY